MYAHHGADDKQCSADAGPADVPHRGHCVHGGHTAAALLRAARDGAQVGLRARGSAGKQPRDTPAQLPQVIQS